MPHRRRRRRRRQHFRMIHRRIQVRILLRNRLPLLRHPQHPAQRPVRQRLHEPVRRPRPTPHRAPASMEKHRPQPTRRHRLRQRTLRPMQCPLTSQNPAVFVGIRIPYHHLKLPQPAQAPLRHRMPQKFPHNLRRTLQIRHRLKQRHHRHRTLQPLHSPPRQPRLPRQHIHRQQILRTPRHRHNQRPQPTPAMRLQMRRQHPVTRQHRIRLRPRTHPRRQKRPRRRQLPLQQLPLLLTTQFLPRTPP